MHPELAAYRESIDRRLAQVCAALDGLSAAQLNYRPPFDGANSAWVLATHALGNARAWVLGIACGQAIGRDRAGEFASAGDDAAPFRAGAQRLSEEMAAALSELAPAEHVVEHASLHLGHLHVVRDLAFAHA